MLEQHLVFLVVHGKEKASLAKGLRQNQLN
jgi:hypothetical protein